MKKLFIIAAIAITSFAKAQDKKEDQTIKMQDVITVPVIVKSYRAKLDLSLQEARYSNPNSYNSFDDMKEELFQKLSKKGIKKSDIVERKAEYYINGRSNEGTTFELVTNDSKKVTFFLSTAIPGTSARGLEYQLHYDEASVDKNIAESMIKMKKRAQAVAKGLGLKVSKVNNIELSQSKEYRQWISYKEDGYISISTEYLLE